MTVSPAILRTLVAGAATATLVIGVAPGLASADAASEETPRSLSTTVGGALLADSGTVLPESAPPLPAFATAQSFVLAEAATGEILAARDPHGRYTPGGIQKMLTALTLVPKLDPGDTLLAEAEHLETGGTRLGLQQDTEYTVEDLLYGMLLASGNDAANLLIDAAPGGSTIGLAAMRAEAKRLQASDTVVVNATGLDAQGQVTSAYDAALIAREGLGNRDFARYVSTEQHVAETSHGPLTWTNGNKLLGNYPGAVGVKTGETPPAGGSYVGAVTRDGRTLLLTLLASADKVSPQAMEIFDWAFNLSPELEPVGELVEPLGEPTTSFVTTASAAEALQAADSEATGEGSGASSGSPSGTSSGTTSEADAAGDSGSETEPAAAGAAAASSASGGLGFGTEAVLSMLLVAFAGLAILLLSARATHTSSTPRSPASAGTRPVRRQPPRPNGPGRSAAPRPRTVPSRPTRSARPARSSPSGGSKR